jgi:hypothetical protein
MYELYLHLMVLNYEPIRYNPNVSVGGIYTVIRSKAYVSTEEMGEQYCLLGPYKEHSARTEVEESDFTGPLHTAVSKMREQGFKVRKKKLRGLSHKRTVPTEQPPLVVEVSAKFCG